MQRPILAEALRGGRDIDIHTGIIAVRYVLSGNSAASTAATVSAAQRTIQLWIARFYWDGIKVYPPP